MGINTVELDGKPFEVLTKRGKQLRLKHRSLLLIWLKSNKLEKGTSMMVLITNMNDVATMS